MENYTKLTVVFNIKRRNCIVCTTSCIKPVDFCVDFLI